MYGDDMYNDVKSFLPGGKCPPDRPVVLDLGVGIGSFALLALDLGCQVIAFDMLDINVNRVVQTIARARGRDGRPLLERFHVFHNGLRCVVPPGTQVLDLLKK